MLLFFLATSSFLSWSTAILLAVNSPTDIAAQPGWRRARLKYSPTKIFNFKRLTVTSTINECQENMSLKIPFVVSLNSTKKRRFEQRKCLHCEQSPFMTQPSREEEPPPPPPLPSLYEVDRWCQYCVSKATLCLWKNNSPQSFTSQITSTRKLTWQCNANDLVQFCNWDGLYNPSPGAKWANIHPVKFKPVEKQNFSGNADLLAINSRDTFQIMMHLLLWTWTGVRFCC